MGQSKNNKSNTNYKHLSFKERSIIEFLFKKGISYYKIWKELNRDKKTVEREIKRNWEVSKRWKIRYDSYKAQCNYESKRRIANRSHIKLFKLNNLRFYKIIECLLKDDSKNRWPSAIIWRYKKEKWNSIISSSTLYRFINLYNVERKKYLRHKWLKYKQSKNNNSWKNTKILKLASIHDRLQSINERKEIWDYELDLIISNKKDKTVLLTIVDRKSRLPLIKKLPNKRKETVKNWIIDLLKWKYVRSLTIDNGTEFTDLIDICNELWVLWYRCDPYSSRQKWTNERTNWMVRFYIPKWANISDYSEEYIKDIEYKISHLPRKILWYKTPNEIFYNTTENLI